MSVVTEVPVEPRTPPRLVASKPRTFLVGAAAVAGLFVALRLAVLWRFPPYYDEGFYGQSAWFAFGHPEARFQALLDNKGPLLTWLAFIPLRIDRDAMLSSVRIVAAAAALVTVPFVGLIARRLAGQAVALVAMAVFALLPFVVVQTSMGIHEPLIMATGTIALYLQIRLAQEPRLDTGMLLGFALAAGLLTKASGVYALMLLPFSLLLFDWRGEDRRRRLGRWGACVGAGLVIVLMGQVLVRMNGDFYRENAALVQPQQYNSPSRALENLWPILQANWPAYRVQLVGYLTVPLVLLAGIGIAVGFARRMRPALLLLAWLLLPLAIATVIANKPLARYYLPAMPEVAIAVAIGLVAAWRFLARRLDGRRRLAAFSILAAVAALPALSFDVRFLIGPAKTELPGFDDRELIADAGSGTGWEELGRELRDRTRGVAAIVPTSGIPTELLPELASRGDGLAPIIAVKLGDPRAAGARYLVANGGPPPGADHREIWSYERVRDGVPMRLYERIR